MRTLSIFQVCKIPLFFFALAAGLTGMAFHSFAQSTDDSDSSAAKPANQWAVNCGAGQAGSGELLCRMVQNIIIAETKQRLLTVIIQPQEGSANHTMTLALPHGLDFTKGVQAKVDDKEAFDMVVQTSNQQGAFSSLPISDQLLADLKTGNEIKFTYQAMNGRTFNIGISLAGFTAAHKKLTSN